MNLGEPDVANRRVWAAMMVARNVDTWEQILAGQSVRARYLDREVYRRTGKRLPPKNALDRAITVTAAMLDRIAAGGPLVPKAFGKTSLREPRSEAELEFARYGRDDWINRLKEG